MTVSRLEDSMSLDREQRLDDSMMSRNRLTKSRLEDPMSLDREQRLEDSMMSRSRLTKSRLEDPVSLDRELTRLTEIVPSLKQKDSQMVRYENQIFQCSS
jgi:hypothetical protein